MDLWGQGTECYMWIWNVPHRLMCWGLVLSFWYCFWRCISQPAGTGWRKQSLGDVSSLTPTCQDISCFALQHASSTNLYLTAQDQQNWGTLDSIKSLKVWPKETRSPFKLFPQTPTSDIKFTKDNVLISTVCLNHADTLDYADRWPEGQNPYAR